MSQSKWSSFDARLSQIFVLPRGGSTWFTTKLIDSGFKMISVWQIVSRSSHMIGNLFGSKHVPDKSNIWQDMSVASITVPIRFSSSSQPFLKKFSKPHPRFSSEIAFLMISKFTLAKHNFVFQKVNFQVMVDFLNIPKFLRFSCPNGIRVFSDPQGYWGQFIMSTEDTFHA